MDKLCVQDLGDHQGISPTFGFADVLCHHCRSLKGGRRALQLRPAPPRLPSVSLEITSRTAGWAWNHLKSLKSGGLGLSADCSEIWFFMVFHGLCIVESLFWPSACIPFFESRAWSVWFSAAAADIWQRPNALLKHPGCGRESYGPLNRLLWLPYDTWAAKWSMSRSFKDMKTWHLM